MATTTALNRLETLIPSTSTPVMASASTMAGTLTAPSPLSQPGAVHPMSASSCAR